MWRECLLNTKHNVFGEEVLFMIQGKVEICGVNTSNLPVLKEEEKEHNSKKLQEALAALTGSR